MSDLQNDRPKAMQIHLNPKNIFWCCVIIGFVYLAFLIWGKDDKFPELAVEIRDVISYAVLAVEMGGHAVAKIYQENSLNIKSKGNTDVGKEELLTRADLVSNHLILGLLKRFPAMNVVTEEKNEHMSESEVEKYRDDNYDLWLNVRGALEKIPSQKYDFSRMSIWIDPLDATQEFTEGLLEYVTVMACVTLDGKPVFGAIYRPFYNETIFGLVNWGLMNSQGEKIALKSPDKVPKTIIVSRSHTGQVKDLADKVFNGTYTVEKAGGAGYKTLRLINGTAEFYIHTTAIKKWDLCAGDALIRAAGGELIDLDGQPLDYSPDSEVVNKKGLLMAIRNPYSVLSRIRNHMPPK
uniref:inositol-phosphate phosphatase n=1 Tax=Acrobeloides nanus TaxID=290746 RepID=A0A914C6Q2_9BILA